MLGKHLERVERGTHRTRHYERVADCSLISLLNLGTQLGNLLNKLGVGRLGHRGDQYHQLCEVGHHIPTQGALLRFLRGSRWILVTEQRVRKVMRCTVATALLLCSGPLLRLYNDRAEHIAGVVAIRGVVGRT